MSDWSTKINVRTVSSNPIIKLLNVLISIIEFLSGTRRSGVMSEENDCLVIDTKTKTLWFFLKSEDVMKIAKSRISGIKVSTVKTWFFFRSTVVEVYASGVTDQVAYEVTVGYKEIKDKAESWLK
jgi:hypothetical protein